MIAQRSQTAPCGMGGSYRGLVTVLEGQIGFVSMMRHRGHLFRVESVYRDGFGYVVEEFVQADRKASALRRKDRRDLLVAAWYR